MRRRPTAQVVVAVCAAAVLVAPAAPIAGAAPPGSVFVVGGGTAVPGWAAERVQEATGVPPGRLAGDDRFATAVAVSRHTFPDGGPTTVYVASGRDFPDALAAATGVAADDAALLLSGTEALPAVVDAELRRLDPQRVLVVGGPAAVTDAVLDDIEQASGVRPVRLDGTDRFTTAVAVSQRTFPGAGPPIVFVASGQDFADALAAAPAIEASGAALLLTAPDGLPAAVADELRRLAPRQITVLGGPAAVGDTVLDDIRTATGTGPARLAGADRFATARAITKYAYPEGAPVLYAAGGWRFADALSALPAVVADGAGMLLVDTRPSWAPDLAEAKAYAAARSGDVSFSVIGTDGRRVGFASDTVVPMASVLKVMFMAVYLRQPDVRDRPLTAADRALLEPMITRSENAPGTRIADALGPEPLYALAEQAGMAHFSFTRPWGLSTTSARDQSRFMVELERYVPDRHRPYALDLLANIVDEQRWGIGEIPTPGWSTRFKGGWGSGTGATDHQVVRLEYTDGTTVALAVMITDSPSHAYGKETLRGVFSRLLADLP